MILMRLIFIVFFLFDQYKLYVDVNYKGKFFVFKFEEKESF